MAPAPVDEITLEVQLRRAKPLPRSFYRRSVLRVAAELVGATLVYDSPEGLVAGRIVETEAYRGPRDKAAHSAGGRRTARTEAMWGPPGHAYMFLLYGMHWAFNVVTGRVGQPHAVLVRALAPLLGLPLMSARRRQPAGRRTLTNGPGKMCAALGLDRRHYGADLCAPPLWITPGDSAVVGCSARINIDYAGRWVDKPWRFFERANRYVSVPPRA